MIEVERLLPDQDHKAGCLVCGQPLQYLTEARNRQCVCCGTEYASQAICLAGHYVCDACHGASASQWIESMCAHSDSTDPLAFANELMQNTKIKMHGPEHHFLVPAVLLTVYYNATQQPEKKISKLGQARKRAKKVLGGFCGFYGACGAGIGTGIFISLITGATPMSVEPWRLANQMTASSLKVIAEIGGPRCCKRDTFLALQSAIHFLKEHFQVVLTGSGAVACVFSNHNRECLQTACPFHGGIG